MRLEVIVHEKTIPQKMRRLDYEVLAVLELGPAHLFRVEVFEGDHSECHVARLVSHDPGRDVLNERLAGHHQLHHAERRECETLHHDLHAEVGDVPACIAEDIPGDAVVAQSGGRDCGAVVDLADTRGGDGQRSGRDIRGGRGRSVGQCVVTRAAAADPADPLFPGDRFQSVAGDR